MPHEDDKACASVENIPRSRQFLLRQTSLAYRSRWVRSLWHSQSQRVLNDAAKDLVVILASSDFVLLAGLGLFQAGSKTNDG